MTVGRCFANKQSIQVPDNALPYIRKLRDWLDLAAPTPPGSW